MKPRCHFARGRVEAWPFVSFLFDEPFQDHGATAGAEWAWLGLVASHRGSTVQQVLPETVCTRDVSYLSSPICWSGTTVLTLSTLWPSSSSMKGFTLGYKQARRKSTDLCFCLSLPSNQFVCAWVCVCISVHAHMHIYACVSMYVSVYACKYAWAIFTANFFF